jgi:hypothetical protein
MTGSCERASQPIAEETTGTGRQPSTTCPSSATKASTARLQTVRCTPFLGRNVKATPYSPGAGSSISSRSASARKKASGNWSKIPAPSPVSWSQPQAPRCCRLRSNCRPLWTVEWLFRPSRCATKPTPHASCSNAGS